MDKWQMYMEIKQLLDQGFSKSKVARKLGVSRSTLYRYMRRNPQEMAEWMVAQKRRERKLDPYKEKILSWLKKHPDMSGAQVHDWLLEQYPSLEIAESTVRDYVRELRVDHHIPKEKNPRSYEAIPESPMGEQVQIDFGQTKNQNTNGEHTKLYFIAFVLSHSRYKYMYWLDRPFTTNDVIEAHEQAFQWYGGMPRELVYDQDNLIVVSENSGDLILTEGFQKYRDRRGLNLRVCRKADPESKGKIENVVGFIKSNFARHRVFHSLDVWNENALEWLNRTGNAKVHNTTKKRPAEVFTLERKHLKPVMDKIIVQQNNSNSIPRTIRKDNTIRYSSNRYSLPLGSYHKYKNVFISVNEEEELQIFSSKGEWIATHKVSIEKGKLIQNRQHRRDRSKGIDAFMDTVASYFNDEEKAGVFLEKVKEKHPRYVRDQLQLLTRILRDLKEDVRSLALEECIKRNLYSATDFGDVVEYMKRQRLSHDTKKDNGEKNTLPLPQMAHWVEETQVSQREMDDYYAILEGESK